MNIEEYRDFCISKPGATESFPFDEEVLVFKVMGKMFALINITDFEFINLKCDPDFAMELREQYHSVTPGWHMNKKLWNSVLTSGDATDDKIFEWIDHSYDMVVKSLTKKLREELANI